MSRDKDAAGKRMRRSTVLRRLEGMLRAREAWLAGGIRRSTYSTGGLRDERNVIAEALKLLRISDSSVPPATQPGSE